MSGEEFDINQDWEVIYNRLLEINAKELLEKHRHPMKIAFVIGFMRFGYILEDRLHNPTWYETEQFRERVAIQAQAYFDDIIATNEINSLMAEINSPPQMDPETKKAIEDLKEINASKERKKLFHFPMRMALVMRTLLIMYIPITHWMHPELQGWEVLAKCWHVLIPVAFIFYFEWKMEQIIKPKFKK